ncbi:hypothetical protein HDV05_007295 [Chytridiales sp. JEL 0842]|nr:hypothetical protein HDV05_007295 [Chytridiales sp. JEL 0842]
MSLPSQQIVPLEPTTLTTKLTLKPPRPVKQKQKNATRAHSKVSSKLVAEPDAGPHPTLRDLPASVRTTSTTIFAPAAELDSSMTPASPTSRFFALASNSRTPSTSSLRLNASTESKSKPSHLSRESSLSSLQTNLNTTKAAVDEAIQIADDILVSNDYQTSTYRRLSTLNAHKAEQETMQLLDTHNEAAEMGTQVNRALARIKTEMRTSLRTQEDIEREIQAELAREEKEKERRRLEEEMRLKLLEEERRRKHVRVRGKKAREMAVKKGGSGEVPVGFITSRLDFRPIPGTEEAEAAAQEEEKRRRGVNNKRGGGKSIKVGSTFKESNAATPLLHASSTPNLASTNAVTPSPLDTSNRPSAVSRKPQSRVRFADDVNEIQQNEKNSDIQNQMMQAFSGLGLDDFPDDFKVSFADTYPTTEAIADTASIDSFDEHFVVAVPEAQRASVQDRAPTPSPFAKRDGGGASLHRDSSAGSVRVSSSNSTKRAEQVFKSEVEVKPTREVKRPQLIRASHVKNDYTDFSADFINKMRGRSADKKEEEEHDKRLGAGEHNKRPGSVRTMSVSLVNDNPPLPLDAPPKSTSQKRVSLHPPPIPTVSQAISAPPTLSKPSLPADPKPKDPPPPSSETQNPLPLKKWDPHSFQEMQRNFETYIQSYHTQPSIHPSGIGMVRVLDPRNRRLNVNSLLTADVEREVYVPRELPGSFGERQRKKGVKEMLNIPTLGEEDGKRRRRNPVVELPERRKVGSLAMLLGVEGKGDGGVEEVDVSAPRKSVAELAIEASGVAVTDNVTLHFMSKAAGKDFGGKKALGVSKAKSYEGIAKRVGGSLRKSVNGSSEQFLKSLFADDDEDTAAAR